MVDHPHTPALQPAVNQARGETSICVNGEHHKLCLTLGALAELEAALGGGSLEALQQRLKNLKASDMLVILHALLRGGGSALTLELLRASDIDPARAAIAIAGAFKLSAAGEGGDDDARS